MPSALSLAVIKLVGWYCQQQRKTQEGNEASEPSPRQMVEVLGRMNARMEDLSRKVEESQSRERDLREKLSSQELIIGLLRDDLRTAHSITTDKFNEALARQNDTFLKLSANFESLTAAVKEGGSGRSGMIDTKGIGKPTIFSNDESKFAVWSKKLENFVSGGFDERARK